MEQTTGDHSEFGLRGLTKRRVGKKFALISAFNCRFTPEQLGITCSSAFVWLIIEILLLVLMTYILNVSTELKYLDLLAYCGYKYVG